jgi:hypothetical protein
MPWKAKINESDRFIELTYSGIVTPDELQEALLAAVTLSKDHRTDLFFADCSSMAGGHSIADLYFLISAYPAAGARHGVKEALLLPRMESPAEEVRFYETACLNKGYTVKVFSEKHDALDWLGKWKMPD